MIVAIIHCYNCEVFSEELSTTFDRLLKDVVILLIYNNAADNAISVFRSLPMN